MLSEESKDKSEAPFHLARTDISKNKMLAERYRIKSKDIPRLIFFKDTKTKIPYTGGKTKDKMAYWLSKVNGEKSEEVSCEDLKAMVASDSLEYMLAFLGDISSDLFNKAHEQYALHEDLIKFVHNQNKDCANEFGIAGNGEILFTKYNRDGAIFDAKGFKEDDKNLQKFVRPKFLPPKPFEFQDEHERLIFDQNQAALFMLRTKDD